MGGEKRGCHSEDGRAKRGSRQPDREKTRGRRRRGVKELRERGEEAREANRVGEWRKKWGETEREERRRGKDWRGKQAGNWGEGGICEGRTRRGSGRGERGQGVRARSGQDMIKKTRVKEK